MLVLTESCIVMVSVIMTQAEYPGTGVNRCEQMEVVIL